MFWLTRTTPYPRSRPVRPSARRGRALVARRSGALVAGGHLDPVRWATAGRRDRAGTARRATSARPRRADGRTVRDRGYGVVLVSQNMADVQAVADRVVVLRRGRLNGEFDAETARYEDIIAAETGVSPPRGAGGGSS